MAIDPNSIPEHVQEAAVEAYAALSPLGDNFNDAMHAAIAAALDALMDDKPLHGVSCRRWNGSSWARSTVTGAEVLEKILHRETGHG